MLANMAAGCVPQLGVVCLLQAFQVKVLLLDLLAAYPAKLDLLNSMLADASLPTQERAFMEQAKVFTQQNAAYGGRLNYQLLFGLEKPVAWDSVQKCAPGFDEAAQVCLLCCLTCTMSAGQCAAAILTLFGVLLPPSSCPFSSAAFTL